jgi:hypothetical protein
VFKFGDQCDALRSPRWLWYVAAQMETEGVTRRE